MTSVVPITALLIFNALMIDRKVQMSVPGCSGFLTSGATSSTAAEVGRGLRQNSSAKKSICTLHRFGRVDARLKKGKIMSQTIADILKQLTPPQPTGAPGGTTAIVQKILQVANQMGTVTVTAVTLPLQQEIKKLEFILWSSHGIRPHGVAEPTPSCN